MLLMDLETKSDYVPIQREHVYCVVRTTCLKIIQDKFSP